MTFDVIAKEFLSTLQSESRIKSYKLYKTAISHFNRFLKKEHDIPLEQIRPSHIHQYQNFFEESISIYSFIVRCRQRFICAAFSWRTTRPFLSCEIESKIT